MEYLQYYLGSGTHHGVFTTYLGSGTHHGVFTIYLGSGTHHGVFTILPRKWDSSWSIYNIT